MAKDRNHNASGAQPRVYKASDVHKRRARGKASAAEARGEAPAPASTIPLPAERGEGPSVEFEPTEAIGTAPAETAPTPSGDATQKITAAKVVRGAGAAGSATPDAAHAGGAVDAGQSRDGLDAKAASVSPASEGRAEQPRGADAPEAGADPADAEGESDGDPSGPVAPDGDAADGTVTDAAPEEPSEDDGAPLGQEGLGRRRHLALRIVGIVFALIAAVCLVLIGMFVAQRWLLNDDAADLQGEWRVADSSAVVAITADTIELNDETSYSYEIDPTAKTMVYRFANLEGKGRYWFSADRKTLILTDGDDYTMWSTALDDMAYAIRSVGDDTLPAGEDSIILRK